jgi:hypothetical protein
MFQWKEEGLIDDKLFCEKKVANDGHDAIRDYNVWL